MTADENLINVLETPLLGRLDESDRSDRLADLAAIRSYIHAEKSAARFRPGRTPPPIAREVLQSVWEVPRTTFHREESAGFNAIDLRSKKLLVPWTVEAFTRANTNKSVAGLILEHVTPIEAMWRRLKEIDEDCDSSQVVKPYEDWETDAGGYLVNHYMLAVLTAEQGRAIDLRFKTKATDTNPFLRYYLAERGLDEDRRNGVWRPEFSVRRFVIAGAPNALLAD